MDKHGGNKTFFLTFNFEILDPHKVVRNGTERFLVPFIQCSPMVTYCKTVKLYLNQGIEMI